MMPIIRHPRDLASGVMFLGVGLVAVVVGRAYPMGTATRMGPGYFPIILGGILVLIGLACVVRSLAVSGDPIGALAWKPLGLVMVSNVLFGAMLRAAGIVPTLILLVMVSAYASRRFAWGPALVLAGGLTAFSALVFVKALGLPMPLLGAWLGG